MGIAATLLKDDPTPVDLVTELVAVSLVGTPDLATASLELPW